MGVIVVGGSPAPVPFAPTLISPANGTFEDITGTPTFQWQYNPGQVGLTQTQWQFYVLVNGGGTAQYWNGTGWQSTPVFNTGSIQSYTFPSGAWNALGGDGNFYQWTVVTKDANGTGPAAAFFTVNAQQIPVVTVLTPSGTVVTSDPILTWSVSYPSGASQIAYRVVIYNNAQYSAGGFTPGSGPSVFDSGLVGSAFTVSLDLSMIPIFLANNTQYRAYVQVTETGGQPSVWAYSLFTVSYNAPKTPTVTATYGTDGTAGCPRIAVTVQGHDNLLSKNDADPTTGIGSWAALANCAVSSTVNGLKMLSTAAGTMTAQTATGLGGYAVTAGTQYTAIASFKTAISGRTCTVAIKWYDNTGTLLSTSTGSGVLDNTSTPTQAFVTATAPVNAAFATVLATVASTGGASEEHDVTQIAILLGADTTWGAGGFVGLQEVMILRSDGLYVRGASQANPASLPAATQFVTIDDYEAVPTVVYSYSAQVIVTFGPNQSVLSAAGTSGNANVPTGLGWWELNPLVPSTAVNASPITWNPVQTEQSTSHPVTGATVMTVVASTMMNQDFSATFELFDDDTYDDFEAIVTSQQTVFVSSPWGPKDSGYFRFAPQSGGMSSGAGNKAKDAQLMPSVFGGRHSTIAVTAIAQYRPQV